MEILKNLYKGTRLSSLELEVPYPCADATSVANLLEKCPASMITPLVENKKLAAEFDVSSFVLKDERPRMGLGSFKALGASYVIAQDAVATGKSDLQTALDGVTYVAASAGNHGLSVAAGARIFGAKAVIFIAETVPESFARRLREKGADVVRKGAKYEASMDAALKAADDHDWRLLSDSSWDGYFERPHRLMEGYLKIAHETSDQIDQPPSHIFLQAGVGGFAGAMAACFRETWKEATLIIVEPEAAPALIESIKAGKPCVTSGPASVMGRLDCKEPSLIALVGLARDADFFVTISEAQSQEVLPLLESEGLASTPSGAAGVAALYGAKKNRNILGLNQKSRVLCFLTEEA